ncbi:iron chaperone [Pyxidicoccus sp. 3LFB2]
MAGKFETVDEYIASFPEDVQVILKKVRKAIRGNVPGGEEKIRYGMPAVMLGGRYAVHFAGWKHHVGLYPIPKADEALEQELAPYRAAKDAVNFPYSQPIPYELIARVTKFVVKLRAEGTE